MSGKTRHVKAIDSFDEQIYKFELSNYPKHVAYLFDGSKLIAVSTNAFGKHAEMGLLPYLNRHRQQRMYVKRLSPINSMSRPCVRCCMSIKHVSPGLRVFYTNKQGEWVEDKNLDANHRSRNDKGQATTSYRLKQKRRKQPKNIFP